MTMPTTNALSTEMTVRLPLPSHQSSLKPVQIFDISKLFDERSQTLRHLLQKGHVTVAPLREPKLILHSHLPHVCMLILGALFPLSDTKLIVCSFLAQPTHLVPAASS